MSEGQASDLGESLTRAATESLQLTADQRRLVPVLAEFVGPLLPVMRITLTELAALHPVEVEAIRQASAARDSLEREVLADAGEEIASDWNATAKRNLETLRELKEGRRGA